MIGHKTFCLDFDNLGYAQGVQDFSHDFTVMRGISTCQVCIRDEQADHADIFEQFSPGWKNRHCPKAGNAALFDVEGVPLEAQIRRAFGGCHIQSAAASGLDEVSELSGIDSRQKRNCAVDLIVVFRVRKAHELRHGVAVNPSMVAR
ncbi:MAG: hypothetical protein JSR28_12910 [Proteobacteria bacterium]|nr:hypothetical protein [Pseudomonadota bacterium]